MTRGAAADVWGRSVLLEQRPHLYERYRAALRNSLGEAGIKKTADLPEALQTLDPSAVIAEAAHQIVKSTGVSFDQAVDRILATDVGAALLAERRRRTPHFL
jgi:hypothetical protein